MVLADHGADVVRIVPPNGTAPVVEGINLSELMTRNKRTLVLDLKEPAGLADAARLIDRCDVLIEGLRPGTTERLGLGSETCCKRNPGLVYARMTGWGQTGQLSDRAGHDINYLALSGTLDAIGRAGERPLAPLNLVGDFGGGSMLLVIGILMALWERERSDRGQVVDAAMLDGIALLSQMLLEMKGNGAWPGERGENLLDSGAPFYDTYVCADGRYVAVGALEPQFYRVLLEGLDLHVDELPPQMDLVRWPELRAALTSAFLRHTRDEWTQIFAGTDACVTPVLTTAEALSNVHLASRRTLRVIDGVTQSSPAPRMSRTPAPLPQEQVSADLADILTEWKSACP
jgi:alpha-methylacyl-CoA racemase